MDLIEETHKHTHSLACAILSSFLLLWVETLRHTKTLLLCSWISWLVYLVVRLGCLNELERFTKMIPAGGISLVIFIKLNFVFQGAFQNIKFAWATCRTARSTNASAGSRPVTRTAWSRSAIPTVTITPVRASYSKLGKALPIWATVRWGKDQRLFSCCVQDDQKEVKILRYRFPWELFSAGIHALQLFH